MADAPAGPPRGAMDAGPGPLDPRTIAELRATPGHGGGDLLADLAAIFRGDAPVQVLAIAAAAHGGDRRELARLTHRLKGGAASIGALPLAATCAAIERAARAGDDAAAAALVGRLLDDHRCAQAALDHLVGRGP